MNESVLLTEVDYNNLSSGWPEKMWTNTIQMYIETKLCWRRYIRCKFLMRTSFLFIKHCWISQHSDWRKLETIKSVRSAVDLSCSDSAVSRSPLSLISSWPAPYKRQDTLLLLSWYLQKHFDTFIELIPLKTRAQEVTMSVHLSPPNCHLILSLRW